MWWYIAFSIVFTVYAVDLLFLFFTALLATVVEYFVPPINTAACRQAKITARKEAAKQQHHAAAAKAGHVKADVISKNPDLSIVVDTRGSIQVRLFNTQTYTN